MPKINQEEYEALKGLNDKWEWIARDENGGLYIYEKKPKKIGVEWAGGRGSYLCLRNETLQFIQWEDEEAYSIQELIEGYESEETEAKKQELIKNIKSLARETSQHWPHEEMVELADVLREIKRLDEPEILSQEWIGENVEYAYFDMLDGSGRLSSATAIIKPEKLKNLLVPKRELPVIPKFVANAIEVTKMAQLSYYDTLKALEKEAVQDRTRSWVFNGNLDTFAKAWMDGFTVGKEPLYRARLKVITNEFIAAYLRTQSSDAEERLNALEIGSKYIHEDYRHLSEFTEEELKRLNIWDSEQWEIEELEE